MRLRDYIPDDGEANTDTDRESVREGGHGARRRPGATAADANTRPTPAPRLRTPSGQFAPRANETRVFPAVAPGERGSGAAPSSSSAAWGARGASSALPAVAPDAAAKLPTPQDTPRRRRISEVGADGGFDAGGAPTTIQAAAPSRRARAQAPATSGAFDAVDAADSAGASAVRRRRSARPASPREQAMVTRTTQFLDATETLNRLDALDATDADRPTTSGSRRRTLAPVSQPFASDAPQYDDADARSTSDGPLATRQLAMVTAKSLAVAASSPGALLWDDAETANTPTERLPATFIPGAMTPATRMSSAISSGRVAIPAPMTALASSLANTIATATTLPPRAPRRRRRGVDALMTVVVTAVLLGLLGATSPLWRTPLTLAQQRFAPQGAAASIGQINQPPTGIWSGSVSVAPNLEVGGGAGPGVKAPGSAGLKGGNNNGGGGGGNGAGVISPAPLSPWPPSWAFTPPPGYYSFGVTLPPNNYYWWAFGQCTWWAQNMRQDENLRHMGNAQYWASSAAARGYSVGSTPVAGATVVFQPGAQGAGGAGHVAHVEKVYPDGWFLISEMNFYWNGGGWGRVDYRYAHSGWGVSFIY